MKKTLSVFLTLAMLIAFGAVAASAYELKYELPTFELPAAEADDVDAEAPEVAEEASPAEDLANFLVATQNIEDEYTTFMNKFLDKWAEKIADLPAGQQEAFEAKYNAMMEKVMEARGDIDAKIAEGDFNGALKAIQKATLIQVEFFQYEGTVMMHADLIKALGGSSFVEFFKFLWSCIVRYIAFGWLWMPIR
ncbi:MAG: hypothetical protein FWF60_02535 [Oscillospiraceae bacterium]|nr:hypothetical protein [Oscillospiraceae bacterium]